MCLPDIDPFENQRQLLSVKGGEPVNAKRWPRKPIFFQALAPEAKTILTPVENFYGCLCFPAEHEHIPAGWILSRFLGEACQAVALLSHIGKLYSREYCRILFDIHHPPPPLRFGGLFRFF